MKIKIIVIVLIIFLMNLFFLFTLPTCCFADEYYKPTDCDDFLLKLNGEYPTLSVNPEKYKIFSSRNTISYEFKEGLVYPDTFSISFTSKSTTATINFLYYKNNSECTLVTKNCSSKGAGSFNCQLGNDSTYGSLVFLYMYDDGSCSQSSSTGPCIKGSIPLSHFIIPNLTINDAMREDNQIVISGMVERSFKYWLDKIQTDKFNCTVTNEKKKHVLQVSHIQTFECRADVGDIWQDDKPEDNHAYFTLVSNYDRVEMYKSVVIPKNLRCSKETFYNSASGDCICFNTNYRFVNGECKPPECDGGYWDDATAKCIVEKPCDEGYVLDEEKGICVIKYPDSSVKGDDGDDGKGDIINIQPLQSDGVSGCFISETSQFGALQIILFSLLGFALKRRRSK